MFCTIFLTIHSVVCVERSGTCSFCEGVELCEIEDHVMFGYFHQPQVELILKLPERLRGEKNRFLIKKNSKFVLL
jgi:hypothetical protein